LSSEVEERHHEDDVRVVVLKPTKQVNIIQHQDSCLVYIIFHLLYRLQLDS
jgi:hypothetical protein